MTKLTLSMDEDIVAAAKRLAKRHRTSVSAMFSGMVKAMAAQERGETEIPVDSVTARLTGILKVPADKTDREILEDALRERYGVDAE
jgi:hypothetical protein